MSRRRRDTSAPVVAEDAGDDMETDSLSSSRKTKTLGGRGKTQRASKKQKKQKKHPTGVEDSPADLNSPVSSLASPPSATSSSSTAPPSSTSFSLPPSSSSPTPSRCAPLLEPESHFVCAIEGKHIGRPEYNEGVHPGYEAPPLYSGPEGPTNPQPSLLAALQLFLDHATVELLVDSTCRGAGDALPNFNVNEFWTFLAVLIAMEITPAPMEDYWNPSLHHPEVTNLMSRQRFHSILNHIRFDDPLGETSQEPKQQTTDAAPAEQDPFQRMRFFMDSLNAKFGEAHSPGAHLSLDESQQVKWGFHMLCLCGSLTGYLQRFEIYPGQRSKYIQRFEVYPGERLKGGDAASWQAIEKLVQPYATTHRRVFLARHLTTLDVLQKLHKMGLDGAGLLLHSRIPGAIRLMGQGRPGAGASVMKPVSPPISAGYLDTGDEIIYYASAYHDLDTRKRMPHTINGVARDLLTPEPIQDVEVMGKGVHRFDALMAHYRCGRKSRQPHINLFEWLVLCAISNACLLQANDAAMAEGTHMASLLQLYGEICRQYCPETLETPPTILVIARPDKAVALVNPGHPSLHASASVSSSSSEEKSTSEYETEHRTIRSKKGPCVEPTCKPRQTEDVCQACGVNLCASCLPKYHSHLWGKPTLQSLPSSSSSSSEKKES